MRLDFYNEIIIYFDLYRTSCIKSSRVLTFVKQRIFLFLSFLQFLFFLFSEYLFYIRVLSHVSKENKKIINRRCLSTLVRYIDRIHLSRVDYNIDKNMNLNEKLLLLLLLLCRVMYMYKRKKTKTKTKRRFYHDVMKTFNSA